jgi:hypothetical protein
VSKKNKRSCPICNNVQHEFPEQVALSFVRKNSLETNTANEGPAPRVPVSTQGPSSALAPAYLRSYNDIREEDILENFDADYFFNVTRHRLNSELIYRNTPTQPIGLYSNNNYDQQLYDLSVLTRNEQGSKKDRLILHVKSLIKRSLENNENINNYLTTGNIQTNLIPPGSRPFVLREEGLEDNVYPEIMDYLLQHNTQLRENYLNPFNIEYLDFTGEQSAQIMAMLRMWQEQGTTLRQLMQRRLGGGKKSNKRKFNKNKKSKKARKSNRK